MTHYRVRFTPTVDDQILGYAVYIADQSGSTDIADRWMVQVYRTIDTLSYWPRRHNLAEEDAYRDYEIRRQIVGNYLALYNVDDEIETVHVIGFRHGSRLPRPDELPKNPRQA